MNQPSTRLVILTLAFFCQAICEVHVTAQDASRPWWNPFGRGDDSGSMVEATPVRDSSLFNSGGDSVFKLPEWKLPSFSKGGKQPSSKKKPSTLTRMGRTTKSWWDNTVDFMNPFEKSTSSSNKNSAGFSQGYQPQNVTKKSGDGIFGWMWREETTETPSTVNDFLRQPRPKF